MMFQGSRPAFPLSYCFLFTTISLKIFLRFVVLQHWRQNSQVKNEELYILRQPNTQKLQFEEACFSPGAFIEECQKAIQYCYCLQLMNLSVLICIDKIRTGIERCRVKAPLHDHLQNTFKEQWLLEFHVTKRKVIAYAAIPRPFILQLAD